ncbi:hypothetical protein BOX15_Mlig006182g1 [Macrostomum lignano]|uniref:3-beta hydroxysteroid dehydrogenase/isomerase domain-containing protein n=2 Tax=Macrostomum lignano TaxID=282301 RepID=A0A267GAK0_9PLAT|nr:hypothetical protein BOX15_Mlig006182g1 [Macrostomum lignano]
MISASSSNRRSAVQPRATVLVTGGSGFLGKKLIKQLASCSEVAVIIALDIRPLPAGFCLDGTDGSTALRFVSADVTDKAQLVPAFRNVDCVIHTAALIELGLYPDVVRMNDVNILGTQNVIDACRECRVPNLIFTSTSELGRCYKPVEGFTEADIDATEGSGKGEVDLLNGYATSKRLAERSVLDANCSSIGGDNNNSRPLCTLIIRPVGIYGEGDLKFIPTFIRAGKRFFGLMPHLGSPDAQIQRVYVGNVAWAHVCAMRCLLDPSMRQQISGQAYLVTDDTPLNSNFQFVRPFLRAHGVRLLGVSVPLVLVFVFWWLLELLAMAISPIVRVPLAFTKNELYLACTTCYYDAGKIRSRLKYAPVYSPEDSFARSLAYYSAMEI